MKINKSDCSENIDTGLNSANINLSKEDDSCGSSQLNQSFGKLSKEEIKHMRTADSAILDKSTKRFKDGDKAEFKAYDLTEETIDDETFVLVEESQDEFSKSYKSFDKLEKLQSWDTVIVPSKLESFENGDLCQEIVIPQQPNKVLIGDTMIRIMHKGMIKDSQIWSLYLNPAFILPPEIRPEWIPRYVPKEEQNKTPKFEQPVESVLKFSLKDLDPYRLREKDKFHPEFDITITTFPVCSKCSPKIPINKLWHYCKNNFPGEIKRWKKIQDIISYHLRVFGTNLNFKNAWKILYNDAKSADFDSILKDEKYRHYTIRCPKTNETKFLESQYDSEDDYFDDLLIDEVSDTSDEFDFEKQREGSEVVFNNTENLLEDNLALERNLSDNGTTGRKRRNAVPIKKNTETDDDYFDMLQNQYDNESRRSRKMVSF